MSESIKPTGLALLRAPFAENQISQLPKPTAKREVMDKLEKATCKICGGYHATSKMIHLAYVGHAALTDRLLDADPNWSWEPMALDPMGYPAIDRDGGMWIKLTVCGVTRLGYGDAQGKTGGDAMKERIGDALRNAAMRFGAALDLWHKGDLHVDTEEVIQRPKPAQQAPPTLTEDQAKYFPRVKAALDSLFGADTAAKKKEISALTEFKGKDEKMVAGVEDYRKLDGKRLEILCTKLEKTVEQAKKNAGGESAPKTELCPKCDSILSENGSCPICPPF